MLVSGNIYRLLRYEARQRGIRWTALMVLKDLDLLGPSSQQTLADIEQVRKPTMTVLMQQMEKHGWIRRGVNPNNARFKLVTITPKGAAKLRTEGRYLKKCLDAKLKGLPESVFRDLDNALGPIAAMWMGQISKDKSLK